MVIRTTSCGDASQGFGSGLMVSPGGEPTRSRRAGYIVDVATDRGDSGAGAYSLDGSLVGVVFATSAMAEGRSFATGSSEVEAFLSQVEDGRVFECEPSSSKLVG